MADYRLTWDLPDDKSYDEIRIYRDTAPILPGALPTPLAVISGGAVTYVDTSIPAFDQIYYRVGGVTLQSPGPDTIALSNQIDVWTYDLPNIDVFWENTAILYRAGRNDEYGTNTPLPPNEGYSSEADLTLRGGDTFYTPEQQKHYGTSLYGDSGSGQSGGMFMGDRTVTATDFGMGDNFGSMCIEGWFWLDDLVQSYILNSIDNSVWGGITWRVFADGSVDIVIEEQGAEVVSYTSSAGMCPTQEWVHIALVRNGTRDWTIYINGIAADTFTQSAAALDTEGYILMGIEAFVSGLFGFMDSFRWTVGVPRYNGNFIPAEFTAQVEASPPPNSPTTVRAIPFYVGTGTRNSNNAAATAPFGTVNWQPGDCLVLHIRNEGSGGIPAAPDGTWTLIDSVLSDDPNTGAYPANIRTTAYYKFADSGENENPVVPDAAGTIHVIISVWRNVRDVGSPIGVLEKSNDVTLDTAVTVTMPTTDGPNQLIFVTHSHSENSTTTFTDPADLVNATERYDSSDTVGQDGTITGYSGVKVTAGAVNNLVGTHGTAGSEASLAFVLLGKLEGETSP